MRDWQAIQPLTRRGHEITSLLRAGRNSKNPRHGRHRYWPNEHSANAPPTRSDAALQGAESRLESEAKQHAGGRHVDVDVLSDAQIPLEFEPKAERFAGHYREAEPEQRVDARTAIRDGG